MPSQPRTGRRRIDDPKVINGIPFVLMTGCRWADLPSYYGSPVNCMEKVKSLF
ncbi:transposase [Methanohalophilus portucalensis]|uniref:Transposase n=1 Tax=Methanohalophilus portucalensis FDF-1 TaxID=523843 RepID=A0A3M9LK25_9EURY|nr:transposase [Methanohalophilus portucalensis]RNI13337.1 transposase [Methanohalophilus portucalensis FDF-1]